MKSRNFFKKGIIWTLVVSLLFGTTAMAASTTVLVDGWAAEGGYNYIGATSNAATKISEAAITYAVAHAVYECLKYVDENRKGHENNLGEIKGADDMVGELFSRAKAPANDPGPGVIVGGYIEKLYADVDDDDVVGQVHCVKFEDENNSLPILDELAKIISVGSIANIFCNGDSPGLVAYTDETGEALYGNATKYSEVDTTSSCQAKYNSTSNNPYYYFYNYDKSGEIDGKSYSNGLEYLGILYENWRSTQKNEYIPAWDDVTKGEGLDNIKYDLLKHDFEAGCGAVTADKVPAGNYIPIDIEEVVVKSENSDVNDIGTIKTQKYYYNNEANSQFTISTGIGSMTCYDLGTKLKNLWGNVDNSYRNAIFDVFKAECKKNVGDEWELAELRASLILDDACTMKNGPDGVSYTNGEWTYDGTQNGTQVCKKIEYSDEQKEAAQGLIDRYNRLVKSDFVDYTPGPNGTLGLVKDDPFLCMKPDGVPTGVAGYEDPFTNITGTATDSCQSNAGALGWIICNVLEMAGSAAESAYESFLKPQLEVNPVLIGATGNDSTANAWAKFQGFANIIFVIVFLVIIFSQLTGYGIDNYGIKKILPKLVVTVILVNLSFVICQVAVDLSNILGNSLQKLFSSIDIQNMTLTETFEGTTDTFQISAGTQTLLWVVLVGVLVGGGIAIWRNPALLISLLVSVLGVLIAGFFVFILLAARQAAIVVLIVLSPLAFVCYALPNTKKLFDKWLKMMQALLLVYPICGLLIGGGDFASRLLLSAGLGTSFAAGLTAMLVGIVPIFFIPTVVKNSMSALGGLGAKISGLGNKVSGGAKGTLKNTRAYKNAQERGKARGDRKFAQARAGVHLDKKTGEFVNNRSPIARLRRRAAGSRVGQFFGADAAMGEQQAKLRGMEEKRQQNAMTAEVGIAPLVNADNLRQKMQNAINEAIADNKVPVVPVDVELAVQRRKSANEAQELKNYKDQFAEYSQEQLRDEAGKAGTWLKEEGGTQKMQALLSAMESRGGMERDMIGMVKNNGHDIGDNEKIMNTLAGSKNKVLKAFGKAGKNQSYDEFMSGTGNGKSLAEYVKEKDVDFLDGLDDKALAQIRNYQTPDNEIMSGSMLAQAASKINSQDATDEIDEMIRSKIESGGKVEFSAAQYANLNNSTQEMLDSLHRSGNSSVGDNLIRISNDMINAPEQYAKLKFGQKDADGKGENGSGTYLNEARARAGLGTMQDAIQSLHVPHNPQPNSGGAS